MRDRDSVFSSRGSVSSLRPASRELRLKYLKALPARRAAPSYATMKSAGMTGGYLNFALIWPHETVSVGVSQGPHAFPSAPISSSHVLFSGKHDEFAHSLRSPV